MQGNAQMNIKIIFLHCYDGYIHRKFSFDDFGALSGGYEGPTWSFLSHISTAVALEKQSYFVMKWEIWHLLLQKKVIKAESVSSACFRGKYT